MAKVRLRSDLQEAVDRGVEFCRLDQWKDGLEKFAEVSREDLEGAELPPEYYSYLGYGVARYQRKLSEGVKLCEYAARLDAENPQILFNLARIHLLLRNRRRAVKALTLGLKLHPTNMKLQELRNEIGVRRAPVIPFLGRNNRLNQSLGRVRASFAEAGVPDDFDDDGLDE